jgi:nitric oxide reductase NorD protein
MDKGLVSLVGAAIHYGTEVPIQQPSGYRLLLILTDDKPNDLDLYEGEYGIEDTRHAIIAEKRAGLLPFCITIDSKSKGYLPRLFGSGHYVAIRDPTELSLLYAKLTQS